MIIKKDNSSRTENAVIIYSLFFCWTDVLKNVANQTVLGPIDFHSIFWDLKLFGYLHSSK